MTFPDFFQVVYGIIGEGKSIHEFAQFLFDQLLETSDDPNYVNPLYEVRPNTIRKYCDPNDKKHNLPAKTVLKIRNKIEPAHFSTYLGTFSDETRSDLVDALKEEIPDIDEHNVCDKCADLFKDILIRIVDPPKETAQLTLFEYLPPSVPDDIAKLYASRLVLEAGGICPKKGCITSLSTISESGTSLPNYQVSLINDAFPAKYENLIALCPSCAERYLALRKDISHPIPYQHQCEELTAKKSEMMVDETGNSVISQHEIEQGVDRLLRTIQHDLVELTDEEMKKLELEYDPVEVRQKIIVETEDEKYFLKKVLSRVVTYFNLVDNDLTNLNKERVIRQRMFSHQIDYLFHDLDDKMRGENGATQEQVYEKLVDWMEEKTGERREICQIVVAYFVQSCEVFDVIPE